MLFDVTLATLGAIPLIWQPLLRRVLHWRYRLMAWAGVVAIGIGVFTILVAALICLAKAMPRADRDIVFPTWPDKPRKPATEHRFATDR